jgi:NAD(P)-dependent dehydrogenase (short-subunit alcohol dehydrogenase family)
VDLGPLWRRRPHRREDHRRRFPEFSALETDVKPWTAAEIPDQTGRVAIVTGANTGIGWETAAVLAAKHARVVLACRNAQKARDAMAAILARAPEADLCFIELDLASLASIARFAASFRADHRRLDLLINNAGVMAPPLGRTEDGFELHFGCNHLGHFALTGRLMDLLQATPGARVVTVSSLTHRMRGMDFGNLNAEKGYRKMAAYGQSKLANLLFTFELQRRLERAGSAVLAVAAHPGWTMTEIQRHSPLIEFFAPLAPRPARGALPTLRAAVDPRARGGDYYGPRGLFELMGHPGKVGTSSAARNLSDADRLWRISEELTGVCFPAGEPVRSV